MQDLYKLTSISSNEMPKSGLGEFPITLFLREIGRMNFQDLQLRLIDELRERVRSGEVTECGLARKVGVSQPHMHHVLKGKRGFSLEKTDEILRRLRLDLLDLIEPAEWTAHHPSG